MILHLGIRTTDPIKVAYKVLRPWESEGPAISQLLSLLIGQHSIDVDKYIHSMVVQYDPTKDTNTRRELMVPINGSVVGLETKVFPSIRGAFLVYKDTDTSQEECYKILRKYIENQGHETSNEFHSIEIMYIPEDLDAQDFTIEIIIPLAG
ncbi:hypothetical protein CL673_05910 [Candidatus Bathyarchaeota archaeon]|jgi:hypothetical protein|nr:hypothetical protein [Candidatus Bathyarchaeota archaeon]MDP6048207.1 hypothetical protein [Candidatus Bathyarchaeota archaeon]|tara:strand:- start:281 stop:733 length:453 start_codon:yes stop_codon:yes gene_type:complete